MKQKPWAHDPAKNLARLNVSKESGLEENEVLKRHSKYGKNILVSAKKRSLWEILVEQFKSLLIVLLLVATLISIVFGEITQGIAIAVVLAINTAIGFFTELKAVRSVEALRKIGQVKTKVRRKGQVKEVPAEELVPGDIVILEAGDIVTADIRLLEASKLQADESTLTGESLPVGKSIESIEPEVPLADRSNMLFKGTSVIRGSGEGVVVSIGMETELGKIGSLVEAVEEQETPLERKLESFGRKMFAVIMVVAVAVTIIGIISGRDVLVMVETGIALAIATVPEGLPVVATIALARGVWRMAQRNALINRLSSVETLGTTTVIDTDKTGTLTENQMTVANIALDSFEVEISGEGLQTDGKFIIKGSRIDPRDQKVLKELIINGMLCNNASLNTDAEGKIEASGEPLEVALLVAGAKAGLERKKLLEKLPEVEEKAFDPDIKMMATVHREDKKYRFAVKGAPESLFDVSTHVLTENGKKPFTNEIKEKWQKQTDKMAKDGLRLLAVATKTMESKEADAYQDLSLLGVVGMLDPPRKGVKEALKLCKNAGISVVMVTGDHPQTAKNIALKVGLIDDDQSYTVLGQELADIEKLSEAEKKRLLEAPIFARVSPEQKLNLVSLQQRSGAVVAMTGDGVNDAPALKKADIGIAMGQRGTQVAREAADMVLKDDNFSSIISAIHSGREIFNNIRNFVFYLLSCNVSEVMIITIATLLGLQLPILPLQILYLNMITDVFPALALGVGKGDINIMNRPPRNPDESLLSKSHWRDMLIYGGIMATSVIVAFVLSLTWFGFDYQTSVTISFLTLAFTQLVHVFNMRDDASGFLHNNISSNRYVWIALALCTALLLITPYFAPLAAALKVNKLNSVGWSLVAVFSTLVWIIGQISIEVRKKFKKTGKR
ncbi:MAG: cation-translocating P-type ATPase [Candidatus Bathyarchaeota archaeon]|nr:cation-translocating P-type ATPase [Candidatus Bathyarchaeum tardum]